jgi:hypothetical protein
VPGGSGGLSSPVRLATGSIVSRSSMVRVASALLCASTPPRIDSPHSGSIRTGIASSRHIASSAGSELG